MRAFDQTEFRLLRLAAQFRISPAQGHLWISTQEVAALVDQMMGEGLFAEQFLTLTDPTISPFEMRDVLSEWLMTLGWAELSDEAKFRFLTAHYARVGRQDDVSSYYAMLRWMEDVGHWVQPDFTEKFVADGIGAEKIYGCYYSYSNQLKGDLIPGIIDPKTHEWDAEGDWRPMLIFDEWLKQNPHVFTDNIPLEIGRFEALKV